MEAGMPSDCGWTVYLLKLWHSNTITISILLVLVIKPAYHYVVDNILYPWPGLLQLSSQLSCYQVKLPGRLILRRNNRAQCQSLSCQSVSSNFSRLVSSCQKSTWLLWRSRQKRWVLLATRSPKINQLQCFCLNIRSVNPTLGFFLIKAFSNFISLRWPAQWLARCQSRWDYHRHRHKCHSRIHHQHHDCYDYSKIIFKTQWETSIITKIITETRWAAHMSLSSSSSWSPWSW